MADAHDATTVSPRYVSCMQRETAPEGGTDAVHAVTALLPETAIVITNGAGEVVLWTAGAERLTGFPARERLGHPAPWPPGATRWPVPGGAPRTVRVASRAFGGARPGTAHVLSILDPPPPDAPSPTTHAPVPWSFDPGEVTDFHGILTRDAAMREVVQMVQNVAEVDVTVLVRGESGSGKELVARALHLESPRRRGPFVAVNCAAFTPSLLESELFGHAKGAFTGAVSARKGIFAQADGGTLFLDEVAELPLDLQAKLLRVLQERVFVPVGGSEPQRVDVRVVAATHRALREEVRAGRFREDLMFRLRVVPIFLPPLRQRPRDIELLLRHFVEELNRRGGRGVAGFEPDAMDALLAHAWPGNVREMRNVVEYAFAVGRGPTIGLSALPPEFREGRRDPRAGQLRDVPPAPRTAPPLTTRSRAAAAREADAARVHAALAEADGDIERAATILGVSRTTFWRMRKRAGV
jgi:two-component system response regulator AtoC